MDVTAYSQSSGRAESSQRFTPTFLQDGGEAGALIRSIDWNKTPLGSVESWSPSLKTAIGLMLHSSQGIYIAWGKEFIQFYNDAYRPILGSTKHPFAMGHSTKDTFPEVWQVVEPLFEKVMRGETVGYENFLLPLNRHGYVEDCYFTFSYIPIMNEGGRAEGIFVTVTETTQRLLAEKELLLSEKRYRALADAMPQLMWTATPDGKVDYANAQCLRYTGVDCKEKFGTGWVSAIHPSDLQNVLEAWNQCMASGTTFQEEYRVQRQDGEYRWFLGRAVPIKEERGSILYWIGTATEIEEQKDAIEKLKLEKAIREQFVATLTHDLRNPIIAAQMGAQMLAHSMASPEKLVRFAGRIVSNLERVNKMVEDLLDANRIKAGEPLKLERQQIDLHSLTQDVLNDLVTLNGDRFALFANEKVINGKWDPHAVRRILENLCSNAAKYGFERTPITVEIENSAQEVKISIHNHGDPISPRDLEILFDPFKRVTTADTKNAKGWGLGLTLVKGLAEAHGGSVGVTSSANAGTTFTVKLPKYS